MIASSESSAHHEEYGFQAGDKEIISKQEHKSFDDLEERVEGPPLWIWAVIVGAIILAKFTLRWSGLKRLARDLRKR